MFVLINCWIFEGDSTPKIILQKEIFFMVWISLKSHWTRCTWSPLLVSSLILYRTGKCCSSFMSVWGLIILNYVDKLDRPLKLNVKYHQTKHCWPDTHNVVCFTFRSAQIILIIVFLLVIVCWFRMCVIFCGFSQGVTTRRCAAKEVALLLLDSVINASVIEIKKVYYPLI